MDLFKAFSSKKLGLPSQLSWELVNGIFTPYDAKDSTYIDKAYKAIPIFQAIISEIIDKASDPMGQMMRITDDIAAKNYYYASKQASTPQSYLDCKRLKTKAFEQIDDHEFLEVMENPNPTMTGKELRESAMGYLLINGNGFIYAASADGGIRAGRPKELWTIPSPTVSLDLSKDMSNPIQGFFISYMGDKSIPEDKVMHVKYFNPISSNSQFPNSFLGLPPMRSAQNMITQKGYADISQGTLFNNMTPAGIIHGNGNDGIGELQPEQALGIDSYFRKQHTGIHNGGGVYVTPANVGWQQISVSPIDLQMLDWNRDMERQVAKLYRYPVSLLSDGGVIANSSEGATQMIRNAVLPVIRRFDDAWTRKIRQWYKDDSLVYMSDLSYFPELQPDRQKIVDYMVRAEVFTTDEIRAELDFGTDYDPSKILVSSGKVPLADVLGGELEIDLNLNETEI